MSNRSKLPMLAVRPADSATAQDLADHLPAPIRNRLAQLGLRLPPKAAAANAGVAADSRHWRRH